MKRHESQVGDRDKLILRAVILRDDSKEVHMTQPVWFTTEDSVTCA